MTTFRAPPQPTPQNQQARFCKNITLSIESCWLNQILKFSGRFGKSEKLLSLGQRYWIQNIGNVCCVGIHNDFYWNIHEPQQ